MKIFPEEIEFFPADRRQTDMMKLIVSSRSFAFVLNPYPTNVEKRVSS